MKLEHLTGSDSTLSLTSDRHSIWAGENLHMCMTPTEKFMSMGNIQVRYFFKSHI